MWFRRKPWQSQCLFLYRSWQCLGYLKRNALRWISADSPLCNLSYRNTNIPGYCCQQSVFCDCYRNMGHFLCSVERIKRFVNVHLQRIVSNVPSTKGRKYSGPPELLRSDISFLRTCNISEQWKSTQTRSYLNEMCILFVFWKDYIFII